jgi:hypothetical protein
MRFIVVKQDISSQSLEVRAFGLFRSIKEAEGWIQGQDSPRLYFVLELEKP